MSCTDGNLELALELSELGASIALPRFERREFSVERKGDGSPVTDVDREVERALRELIAQRRPDHAVLGEEYGATGESEWRWYLDPIDGTQMFIDGGSGWMVLIALAHRGEVVAAAIDLPARGTRWWAAAGRGAWRDGERLEVSSVDSLDEAVVRDNWRGSLAAGRDIPLAWIAARAGAVLPHAGHSLLAVAAGEADAALGLGGFSWDYAAPFLVVTEAGGRFTDFEGRPRFDARQAVVTNGRIHDEVLEALREGWAARAGAVRSR